MVMLQPTIHSLSIYERKLAELQYNELRAEREKQEADQEALNDAYYSLKRINDRYREEEELQRLRKLDRRARSKFYQNFDRLNDEKRNIATKTRQSGYSVKSLSSRAKDKELSAYDLKEMLPSYVQDEFMDEYNSTEYGHEAKLFRRYIEEYEL